jgi:hypothetical protein
MSKTKTCVLCGLEKEFTDFYVKGAENGSPRYDNKCKVCRAANNKIAYQEHRDERVAQKREYYKINREEYNNSRRDRYNNEPEYKKKHQETSKKSRSKNKESISKSRRTGHARYSFTKSSAKQRELSFSLLEAKYILLINSPCYYCDNQLDSPTNSSGIGLDRLDNDKGYEMDNVIPCCVICNRTRNAHFTPEETKVAVQAVITFRKNKIAA